MFCKKCGKQLNDGAKVCPNCGTKVNSTKSLIDIFNEGKGIWLRTSERNLSDCMIYPTIREEARSTSRQNFGISFNEQILFIRDTSFWNSRDQGLVITDNGVYCIPDNNKPDEKIILPWSAIKYVEYKELYLYFWGYSGQEDDHAYIGITFFKKSDGDKNAHQIGCSLAETFTAMAQSVEPEADPYDEALEQFQTLYDEKRYDEALQFALSCKNQDFDGSRAFYAFAADCYMAKGDYNNAIALYDEALKYYDPQSGATVWLNYYKYSALHQIGNDIEARKYTLPVIQNATEDMKRNDGLPIREDAMNDLEIYDKEYVAHFLEMPYNKRKVLLPVNNYTDLNQEHMSVIDIKRLESAGIQFPIGHPVAYQLYVGHPYLTQKYLPFENYELELIEDKVREFCQLAQCLGATEISIESLNSSSSDQRSNSEMNASGKVDYRFASAQGSGNRNKSRHLIEEISQSINLHQKFKPNTKPHLPENLVWYPNEPSWQRLYEQRMQGALQQHEERIETRKSRVLEGTELNSIQGEFKNLLLAANGHWDKKMEEKFELQENAVLAIHVQFAGLNELDKAPITSTSQYSDDEKEYLEELKTCLSDAEGEISTGERRLLERLRRHLGISEERAAEIENSLKPQLSDEEKEYLEEFKLCLEDGNNISSGERRLLDKLRNSLGISEERAKEIENMF